MEDLPREPLGIPPERLHGLVDAFFYNSLLDSKISISEIYTLCSTVIEIFAGEPSLLALPGDVLVVGDVHGQFYDLLGILADHPSETYLFLGDYVDRGENSLETILLLFHIKVRHPNRVYMLRGNHESRRLSQAYGFYEECVRNYETPCAWSFICDAFDYLPLAATVGGKVFAVHGGIGPSVTLKGIAAVDRVGDVPLEGVVAELLWSDPDAECSEYRKNTRGAGYLFGEKQVDAFLKDAGLEAILRSHQLVDAGYRVDFSGKVLTVWSAPNYCYRCMNKATVAAVKAGKISFIEVKPANPQRRSPRLISYFI